MTTLNLFIALYLFSGVLTVLAYCDFGRKTGFTAGIIELFCVLLFGPAALAFAWSATLYGIFIKKV